MYADKVTDSMRAAIDETRRRRAIQEAFNREHNITPRTIIKSIQDIEEHIPDKRPDEDKHIDETTAFNDIPARIEELTQQMKAAAQQLDFENAALLRDRITVLRRKLERK